jgi:hypothetical protein
MQILSTGFQIWLPNMTWGGTQKNKFEIETLETGDMPQKLFF